MSPIAKLKFASAWMFLIKMELKKMFTLYLSLCIDSKKCNKEDQIPQPIAYLKMISMQFFAMFVLSALFTNQLGAKYDFLSLIIPICIRRPEINLLQCMLGMIPIILG